MTLIIPAYKEAAVIAAKVANARALDYPDLEIIVAVDGGDPATVDGGAARPTRCSSFRAAGRSARRTPR